MNISPISITQNKQNQQNFGHTFRVQIFLNNPQSGYTHVNPASNTKLYKQLNGKLVGLLNEGFISDIRNGLGISRKANKKKTETESKIQKDLVDKLKEIDTDFRELSTVRSVYPKNHVAYIATGIDVPIIENIMGAKNIGQAKTRAKWKFGSTHQDYINKMASNFNRDSVAYASSAVQTLRSPEGKEIYLSVAFNPVPVGKKGKVRYEFSGYKFYDIQSAKPMTPMEKIMYYEKYATNTMYEVIQTVKHQINRITKNTKNALDSVGVLFRKQDHTIAESTPKPSIVSTSAKAKKIAKGSDNGKQLTIDFGEE